MSIEWTNQQLSAIFLQMIITWKEMIWSKLELTDGVTVFQTYIY